MTHYLSRTYIREKWHHAGFQKYFQNTGWMFLGKILSLAIAFIATAYIARNLGPTNYGQLSYAISYVGLFGFLATLGIDQTIYRDIIRFPERRNEYLGTAIALRIGAALVTIIACIGFAAAFSDKDVSLFLIFILSLAFVFNPFQLLSHEFQAEAKGRFVSLLSLAVVLILNILKIAVVALDQGVIYLAGIILLEPILYAIGYAYMRTRSYGSVRNLRFEKNLASTILRDSFPLIFASAFFAIYARIDQVMIKNMVSTEAVGLYDAAVRISELWYFIPNIIVASLFPAIINAKKTSEDSYRMRARKLIFVVACVSIATALITTLLSKQLILIIFGSGFLGALTVLNIYVWSNIGASLNFLSQQLLIAENLSKRISFNIFLGMVANIALNLILIPQYGISGAAIATLISYTVPFLSLFIFKDSRTVIRNIFIHE